jgi:hypothetical protein
MSKIEKGDYTVGDVGVDITYETDENMTGLDIDFIFIKPSGQAIIRENTSISTTTATYTFAAGDLDEAGTWRGRLKNQDGPYEYKPDKEEFVVTAKSEDQAVG